MQKSVIATGLILTTLILGSFFIPEKTDSTNTFLQDTTPELLEPRDISKVLNYISYSLNDTAFGVNSTERYYNATTKLIEKQPGLEKYLTSLKLVNCTDDIMHLVDYNNTRQFVSIRGSQFHEKWFSDLLSETTTFNQTWIDLLDYQAKEKQVFAFLNKTVRAYDNQGYETFVSGHSLGGVLSISTCAQIEWVEACYVHNPSTYPVRIFGQNLDYLVIKILANSRRGIDKIEQTFMGKDLFSTLTSELGRYLEWSGRNAFDVFVNTTQREFAWRWGYLSTYLNGVRTTLKVQPEAAIQCGYGSQYPINYLATLPEFNGSECLKGFKHGNMTQEVMESIYKDMVLQHEVTYRNISIVSNCAEGQYLGYDGCITCGNSEYSICHYGAYYPTCRNIDGYYAHYEYANNRCTYCSKGYQYDGYTGGCKACPAMTTPYMTAYGGECQPLVCNYNEYIYKHYSGKYKCGDCPSGYGCNGVEKTYCGEGTYSDNGRCVACRYNQYSYKHYSGKYKCVDCPRGYSCNGRDKNFCGETYMEVNGVCVSCRQDQYSKKTSSGIYTCIDCPFGYSCNGNDRTRCPSGTEGQNGVCRGCAANQYTGRYSATSTLTKCYDCPFGYSCNGKDKQRCPSGTQGENGVCRACASNQYTGRYSATSSLTKCFDCPYGYSCNGKDKERCPKGTEGHNGVCIACGINQYTGRYSATSSLGKCFDCPFGYSCDGKDKDMCDWGSEGNNGVCVPCGGGQYSGRSCATCGTYKCYDCPSGYRCDGKNKYSY